jgi:hypothetical protein
MVTNGLTLLFTLEHKLALPYTCMQEELEIMHRIFFGIYVLNFFPIHRNAMC